MIQQVTQDDLFTLSHDHVYYPAGGLVHHLNGLVMETGIAALLQHHVQAIEYSAARNIRIYGVMQTRSSDDALYTYPPVLLTPQYYGIYQIAFAHDNVLLHIAKQSLRTLLQYVDKPYFYETTFGVVLPSNSASYFKDFYLPENVCFYEYVHAREVT